MRLKPVVPRELARRDVESIVNWYRSEAGTHRAVRFVEALHGTYDLIAAHPASGSPRYAYEFGLSELRTRLIPGYPYLVFYIEHESHIDLWRVLHATRDIPAWLGSADN